MNKQMSVAQRLILGFGLIVVLLLACVGVAINGYSNLNKSLDQILNVNNKKMLTAAKVVAAGQEMRAHYRTVIIVENDAAANQKAVDSYNAAKQRWDEGFKALKEMISADGSDAERAVLAEVEKSFEAARSSADETVRLGVQDKTEEATKVLLEKASPLNAILNLSFVVMI